MMIYNAKNGSVKLGDTSMDFVYAGKGEKKIVLLPGLSEGLSTVRGKAAVLLFPYRKYFERFTVYMFSRKRDMPTGYSIREMAEDQARALKALNIESCCVLGVSQGGMIAQYLAVDHPELVEKLAIAVSAPRVNGLIREYVAGRTASAQAGDHKTLMTDTVEMSYSPKALRKYRKLYPVFGLIGKPKSYDRFLINANAILGFDAYDELGGITCPTLVLAGEDDRIVGVQASRELHARIPGSELHIYPGLGHAAFEEAKDFNERVFGFFG